MGLDENNPVMNVFEIDSIELLNLDVNNRYFGFIILKIFLARKDIYKKCINIVLFDIFFIKINHNHVNNTMKLFRSE